MFPESWYTHLPWLYLQTFLASKRHYLDVSAQLKSSFANEKKGWLWINVRQLLWDSDQLIKKI